MKIRGKKNLLLTFLGLLVVWPPIHFGLARAYDIEIWHLAGWAMYIRPHLELRFEATQLDGSPFPEFDERLAVPENGRYVRNLNVIGTLASGRPIAERILEQAEPGSVDGIELRVIVRKFDPSERRYVDETRETIRIEAETPRDPRAHAELLYDTMLRPSDVIGTRWDRPDEYPDFVRSLFIADRSILFRYDDGTWDEYRSEPVPHEDCGSYPLCFTLRTASGNTSAFPIYLENGYLYPADCEPSENARFGDLTDEEIQGVFQRTIVWRAPDTTCSVSIHDDGFDPEVPFVVPSRTSVDDTIGVPE